jgi:hypothetical protein
MMIPILNTNGNNNNSPECMAPNCDTHVESFKFMLPMVNIANEIMWVSLCDQHMQLQLDQIIKAMSNRLTKIGDTVILE